MNRFHSELKNGRFVCSACQKCNKFVWPPNDFCNACFEAVLWKPVSTKAKIIEFSKKEDTIFCIAEFENSIRVLGTLEAKPENAKIGQELKLISCGYDGKEKFVFQTA